MDKLILIGGGGHCRSCIDVVESGMKYKILGILDLPHLKGATILGYPVIGTDELIPELVAQGYKFLITIGQLKNNTARKSVFQKLESDLSKLVTVISQSAVVSKHSLINPGSIVMHNAVVNAGATIGYNCIINTGSLIEHDSKIGDHSHIATHAVLNGDCVVGNDVFVGSGAIVINGIRICDESIIAAGTIVNRSINESGTYAGNPCHKIK